MNVSYADDEFDKGEDKAIGYEQDKKISDVTNDLPNFYVKPKQTPAANRVTDEENVYDDPDNSSTETYDNVCSEDHDENLELIGGQPLEQDVHTLVRNTKKQLFTRDPVLRGSMVGMKEGVPGIFSGYDRKEKIYSKLDRSGSESSATSESSPVRPPRKARGKSDSSVPKNEKDNYDKLWASKKNKNNKNDDDDDGHLYSVLGKLDDEKQYDEAEEGNVLSSSPIKDSDKWLDKRKNYMISPGIKDRPMSTVVLPISPVEENSESESDWGSEFDDIVDDNGDDDLYEIVGDMSEKIVSNRDSVMESLTTVRAKTEEALQTKPHIKGKPLPPLPHQPTLPPLPPLPPVPNDDSLNEQDEDSIHYVDIGFDGKLFQLPSVPILNSDASEDQVKRYQLIKYIFENEKDYITTLHTLIQDYERPLKNKKIISQESTRVIFQHLQEIEQCHQLFNIALTGRMSEWDTTPKIGDIIYASFSNSMVLKAYSSYVKNFTKAMELVKDTCRLVPAFLSFLRGRLSRSHSRQTFYDLLKRPLGRFPQLVVLLQELLKVTPIDHCDRMSLQMALTQLECLSELICEKRRDIEMKYRVLQLDKYFTGLSKPLFSSKRYHIRHDNMLLCKVVDGQVVKTKLRRLFLLSDLLICASIINKSKAVNKLSKKRYRVKWCVPVAEVDIVDVGSGILVNIDNNKTTTIKYTHPVSSPRPGCKNIQEELETLQHDLAVIGQIAGLVATLRKKYDLIDENKVSEWYRSVKETFENETEIANMRWLELALPTKDKKTATYLFKLSHPRQKMEWTTELDNAKLRLGCDNNPGWYILEDETANTGNMGILRRNLPLLGNKVPLFMVEAKFTIECVLEVTPPDSMKPILWIFSGNDHTGQVTLMEMSMSSVPHVIENFIACKARILAAEVVKDEPNRFNDALEQKTLVWCGTMSGSIHIYNASSENDHEEIGVARLRDAVLCFKHIQNKVFCGLANGTVACFRKKADAAWDLDNPTIVCLGKSAVMTLTEAAGRLWCACDNFIFIIDIVTLGIEHRIITGDRPPVKHLVSYGSGVWASIWKTPKLHLYHSETFECLQSISVTTPLVRMRYDIDSRIQNIAIEKAHITCLQARGGLLWVGTDVGIIVTYPLPRLGGVPQVSGRPCVSFHGHEGSVRCLHAFRVERNFRCRGETEDFDARSLFYVDPFDEAASGLNIPAAITNSVPETPSETPSNEPFYFTVLPDGTPKTTAQRTDASYEDWLKSFGKNPKEIDPLLAKERGIRIQNDGYDSDESMDSDTEFSFIEDKARRIPAKTKKNAHVFSINIKPPSGGTDGPVGTVNAKKANGGLPVIDETNFADMMKGFDGFEMQEKLDKSTSCTDFVMIEKSESGYEEPIPAPEKVVKVPYATVNKDKAPDNGSDSGNVFMHSFSIDETPSSSVGMQPDEKDVEKYRNEPLPELPVKTLYQTAKEWTNKPDKEDVNLKQLNTQGAAEERTNEICVDGEKAVEDKSEISCEHVYESYGVDTALPTGGDLAEDSKETCEQEAEGQTKEIVMNDNDMNSKNREDGKSNEEITEIFEKPAPISTENQSELLQPDSEDQEVENINPDAEESNVAELLERNVKSPLCITVTDNEAQEIIQGSIDVDGGFKIERKESVLSKAGADNYDREITQIYQDTLPEQMKQVASLPYAPHPKTPIASSHTLPIGGVQTPTDPKTPDNVDLTATKYAEAESMYTPLLNQTEESNTSSLSGVGARQFDNDMALSTSLARENSHGYYTSLTAVSNRDADSRRELLMKPMYVLSVGSGYLDLRKKQKLGSGIEFFKNLTASEPEPKLLIWKIIS